MEGVVVMDSAGSIVCGTGLGTKLLVCLSLVLSNTIVVNHVIGDFGQILVLVVEKRCVVDCVILWTIVTG